jgi:hypothetical protein
VKNDRLVAAGIAVCWGCVVAVGCYAVVRSIQFFVYPDPNPATLVWSAHAGFFWRSWTCGYAGGISAFVAYLAARGDKVRVARGLGPAIVVASVLLALQVAFLP